MSARVPKSLTVCLKCGNSGHDMFSCRNDYSPDDLKVVLFFFVIYYKFARGFWFSFH